MNGAAASVAGAGECLLGAAPGGPDIAAAARLAKNEVKGGLGTPVFRESDGPLIAQAAHEHGLLACAEGSNQSYADFLAELDEWS